MRFAAVASGFVLVLALGARAGRAQTAPLKLIAYGDTRFTALSETTATSPVARKALIERIAAEHPDAILMSGDVPWHGGTVADYEEYANETKPWRDAHLLVLPALGNHEFAQCQPDDCVAHWWAAFPEHRGERWYARTLGTNVRALTLDSMSSLLPGSAQRAWIDHEIASLAPGIRFVLINLHHPPVADVQTRIQVDHNPRPNEIALADYLETAATTSRARFLVIAGHIHNYERRDQHGVTYLVSGGGGAAPVEVDRTPGDLYQGTEFPNYHYVRLTFAGDALKGEMFRLDDAAAPTPHFTLRDTFEIHASSR